MNGYVKKFVGRFRCDSSVLIVADPHYLGKPDCSTRLATAKPGMWNATITCGCFPYGGERVAKLTITHESLADPRGGWCDCGAGIGVDTGRVAICDSGCEADFDRAVPSAIATDHGALSSSGFGDGVYPCFVQEYGGEIVGVEIRFIDEDVAAGEDADRCELIGGPFDGYPVPEDEQANLFLYVKFDGRRVAVYEDDGRGRLWFTKIRPMGEGVMPNIWPVCESEGGER